METETLSPDQARQVIDRHMRERVEACRAEVNAVLDQHGCAFDVSVLLRQGQVIPHVGIVLKEGQQ